MKTPIHIALAGAILTAGLLAPIASVAAAAPYQQAIPKLRYAFGTVQSWSPETRLLKLGEGGRYKVDPNVVMPELGYKEKVVIGWAKTGKDKVAYSVAIDTAAN